MYLLFLLLIGAVSFFPHRKGFFQMEKFRIFPNWEIWVFSLEGCPFWEVPAKPGGDYVSHLKTTGQYY